MNPLMHRPILVAASVISFLGLVLSASSPSGPGQTHAAHDAPGQTNGVLPPLVDPLWDTSHVLDDSGRLGGLIASFTGYRARPALLPLLALAAYWIAMWTFLRRASRATSKAPHIAPHAHSLPRAGRN